MHHTWGTVAVLDKRFKRAKQRSWRIRLTRGKESKSRHADLSEDSERDLFDGRWPSSSEDATLEEEGMVVTGGGRLPRFLNLLSKLRFLNSEGHRAEVSTITRGRFENTYSRTVVRFPPASSSRARPAHIKVKDTQLSVERSAPSNLPP